MTGWISATGRTIGLTICSAMLLISATLGQSGQASPPRSFPLEAVQAASNWSAEPAPPVETATTTNANIETVSGTVPETVSEPDSGKDPYQEQSEQTSGSQPDNQPDLAPPTNPVPQAGSGFVPPHDGFRFNKASQVRMAPVRIQIPNAWVDAPVQTVGVTPEGEMETPDDYWNVGWYRYGTRPGDAGKAVMAGHLDSQEGAAVFYFLSDLQPGDDIRILLGGGDGERFYKVREVASYHLNDAPLDKIFGPSDTPELILITCGGEWRGADAGGYDQRTVVYADMVIPAQPAEQAESPEEAPQG